jgi:hypothetical protein
VAEFHAAPWFDESGVFDGSWNRRAAAPVVSATVAGSRSEDLVLEIPAALLRAR